MVLFMGFVLAGFFYVIKKAPEVGMTTLSPSGTWRPTNEQRRSRRPARASPPSCPAGGPCGQRLHDHQLEDAVGLARKNSIWPLPFATSCCGIEFMATMGSNYDLARFGMERLSFSPARATC
jgi:hypothetical protein